MLLYSSWALPFLCFGGFYSPLFSRIELTCFILPGRWQIESNENLSTDNNSRRVSLVNFQLSDIFLHCLLLDCNEKLFVYWMWQLYTFIRLDFVARCTVCLNKIIQWIFAMTFIGFFSSSLLFIFVFRPPSSRKTICIFTSLITTCIIATGFIFLFHLAMATPVRPKLVYSIHLRKIAKQWKKEMERQIEYIQYVHI